MALYSLHEEVREWLVWLAGFGVAQEEIAVCYLELRTRTRWKQCGLRRILHRGSRVTSFLDFIRPTELHDDRLVLGRMCDAITRGLEVCKEVPLVRCPLTDLLAHILIFAAEEVDPQIISQALFTVLNTRPQFPPLHLYSALLGALVLGSHFPPRTHRLLRANCPLPVPRPRVLAGYCHTLSMLYLHDSRYVALPLYKVSRAFLMICRFPHQSQTHLSRARNTNLSRPVRKPTSGCWLGTPSCAWRARCWTTRRRTRTEGSISSTYLRRWIISSRSVSRESS